MSTGLVIQVAERRDCDEARNIHGRLLRAGRARSVLRDPEIIGMDMSSSERLRIRMEAELDRDPDQLIVIASALVGSWWFIELVSRLATGG